MKNKNNFNLIHIILLLIIFIIGFILLVHSSINIYKWLIDSSKTSDIIKKVNNIVNIQEEGSNINVDLSELKKINPDTVGWIQVTGTDVNYPFTQTTDNDFYLTHSFDKSYNSAGWVFLDYRNNLNNFDKNTIIYAHGRLDKTMFGSLKNVFENDWYNKTNNHLIKLSSETQNTIWEIFSVYRIAPTEDYIQTNFASDKAFQNFISMIKSRSIYNFDIAVTIDDNILTLSTCYNNNRDERIVIHAKLIK